MIEILLPCPPSVNGLYPTKGKRRIKSKRYVEWINEASRTLSFQDATPMSGRLKVEYRFSFKHNRGQDLENFVKATSDFLVSAGLIPDDSNIDMMTLIREPVGGASVFVQVRKMTDEEV